MTVPDISVPISAKQRAASIRCDAMVRHACDQIMAVGVERFSLNEVLRLSGGSKATLVKYFGDRDGLIATAIGVEAQRAVKNLELENTGRLPVREALEKVLTTILRFYLLPGSIALYRAVVGAADPKGSDGFYTHGHKVIVDAVAGILEARGICSAASSIDSRDMADQLLHAIRAGFYERALIGLPIGQPDDSAIAERARRVVAMILPMANNADGA